MSCGLCSIRCCQSTSIRIALVEDVPASLIGGVLMRSSTCCALAESAQALDQTELCAHSTAHDRFQAWGEAGVFLKLWQAGVKQIDELCETEWDWLAMDGAMSDPRRSVGKKLAPIRLIGASPASSAAY